MDIIKNLKKNWKDFLMISLLVLLVLGSFGSMPGNFKMNSISSYSESSVYDQGYVSKMASSYYDPSDSLSVEERKLIRNANLDLEVANYDLVKTSIDKLVTSYDGIILSESESKNYYDNRNLNMRIKVDSESLDNFLDEIKVLGKVENLNVYSNDVTGQYIDSNEQLVRYEQQVSVYEEKLLRKDITVEEEIQIQTRIDDLQNSIAYLKKRIESVEEDVSFSEVHLSLSEEPSILDEVKFLGFKESFQKFLDALNNGWKLLLEIVGFVIPFAVIYVLYLIGRRFSK